MNGGWTQLKTIIILLLILLVLLLYFFPAGTKAIVGHVTSIFTGG